MKIYTVHTRNLGTSSEDIVLVREGFSWAACFFHFILAFYNKMPVHGLVLLGMFLLLSFFASEPQVAYGFIQSLQFGTIIFVGCNFNDWYRSSLTDRGYVYHGLVSGKDEDEASYKAISSMLQCNSFVPSQT